MATTIKNRVKYTKLKAANDLEVKKSHQRFVAHKTLSDDDYYDDQFEDSAPVRAPVKSICVAIALFVLGTIMLTLGSLMLAGVINQGGGSFRAAPLMVIGSIVFIPGAYNVRTAYYAWKGYQGYSFSDIAGFGEDQAS